jgi:hypothetical protein
MASNIPKPEAVQSLAQSAEPGKVVMLNLLKFKPTNSAASYGEYAGHVTPIVERIGAKTIFAGPACSTVIGDSVVRLYPAGRISIAEGIRRHGDQCRVPGDSPFSRRGTGL